MSSERGGLRPCLIAYTAGAGRRKLILCVGTQQIVYIY